MSVNIGDIVFGLGADASRLRSVLSDIDAFGNAVENAAAAAAAAGTSMDKMWLRQEAAIVKATTQMQNFNARLRQAGAPPALIAQSQNAFAQLSNELTKGTVSQLEYQRAMEQFNASMSRNQRGFAQWKAEAAEAASKGSGFSNMMKDIARAASLTTGPLSGIAFRLTVMSELLGKGALDGALFIAGIAGAGYAFAKLSEHAIATEMHLVGIRNQLFALSGSLAVARADMNYVMETADKFGIKFDEVASGFAKMDLAARGSKIAGEGVREMFTNIIAVAGNLTLSQENLSAILNTVERSLTKGVVQWRDLRGELSRQIPNAMILAAEAMAKTEPAMDHMIRRGEVMADVMLPKLFAAMVKAYGVDATKGVDNLVASHNRLYNATLRFNNTMDQTFGFSASWKRTLDLLTAGLDTLSRHMDTIGKVAIIAAGGLAGLASVYVVTGLTSIAMAVIRITQALTLMNFAATKSPIMLIVKLAAAAAGAYIGFEEMDKILGKVGANLIGGAVDVDEYVKAWDKLKAGVSSTTQQMIADQKKAMETSKAMFEDAYQQADEAQKKYEEMQKHSGDQHAPGFIGTILGQDGVSKFQSDMAKAKEAIASADVKVRQYAEAVLRARANLEQLQRVLQEQQKQESGQSGRDAPETQAEVRMRLAMEQIQRLTKESNEQWEKMKEGPAKYEDFMEKLDIEKKVAAERKQLESAGFSRDEPDKWAEATKAVENYTTALTKLKDQQKFNKDFVQGWQLLDETFQDLGKTGVGAFVKAINTGTLSLQTLQSVAYSVITNLEQKFLELAVVNPIINALFGGGTKGAQLPAFSLGGGGQGSGVGGLFGKLFGGIGGGSASTDVAAMSPADQLNAGIIAMHGGSRAPSYHMGVNPGIFNYAPRLHSGLMPDEFPAILQQGEQVIPRGGGSGGTHNYHIEAHMHYESTPPDANAQKQQQQAMHKMLGSLMDDRIARAMAPGGVVARAGAARYG
jgi:tape measure domain-containing protein